MENNWETIKQKKTERLEKEVKVFTAKLEKIRTNRINLELIRGLMVNCPGERRPLKAISNLRVSANHELVIHAFEPKLLPPIINALNQLGGYKLERSTSDEAYFSLLLMTRETKDKFIREVKVIGVEAKVALNLVRQEIRDLVKKNKEFSQDQKRNYENQIDKITKIYQDKINAAEEKKIQELNL